MLAGALIPVQIHLRRHIAETSQPPLGEQPVRGMLSPLRGQWVLAVILIFGGTVPTYVATYVTTFGVTGTSPSAYASFATTAVVGSVTLALSVAGGWLADRIGRLRTIACARALTMAAVVPAFHYAAVHPQPIALLAVVALFAGLSALAGGPTIALILEMFPRRGRAVAMSLVYATGVALFGGTTPFVVASFNAWAGTHGAAGWYVFVSAATTLIAIGMLRLSRIAAEQSKAANP
jgi:MFS family permease